MDKASVNRYKRKAVEVEAAQVTPETAYDLAVLYGFNFMRLADGEIRLYTDERIAYPGNWLVKVGEDVQIFTDEAFKERYEGPTA